MGEAQRLNDGLHLLEVNASSLQSHSTVGHFIGWPRKMSHLKSSPAAFMATIAVPMGDCRCSLCNMLTSCCNRPTSSSFKSHLNATSGPSIMAQRKMLPAPCPLTPFRIILPPPWHSCPTEAHGVSATVVCPEAIAALEALASSPQVRAFNKLRFTKIKHAAASTQTM